MADLNALKGNVADWLKAARANPLFSRGLLGAAAVASLDQVAKYVIVHVVNLQDRVVPCAKKPDDFCRQIAVSPIFDLTYVENRGASFGMLAGGAASRVFLTLLSIAVASFLVSWLARIHRPLSAAAVALIIGGAIGNLIDRLRFGYVVDFLDFSGLFFPWVFNVADASINVGIALLVVDWRRERSAARKKLSKDAAAGG
ncbi:MAG: signal peptidase II [Parvularculaceae bacterium]